MGILTRLTRRLATLAEFLEDPRLFRLRAAGGDTVLFRRLNQPWLRALGLQSALDIGANVGQFALALQTILPEIRLYSFEPLPECFAQLQRRMAGARRFAAFNLGVGDRAGRLTFEQNEFTPSSSFLQMAEAHRTAFPFTRATQSVEVEVRRLDDLAAQLELREPFLVKIDVQGYEDRVLQGGEATLRRAEVILIETSFETLYEGQILFDGLYRRLVGWGFAYRGALEQLTHPADGHCLQADSVFVRAPGANRGGNVDAV